MAIAEAQDGDDHRPLVDAVNGGLGHAPESPRAGMPDLDHQDRQGDGRQGQGDPAIPLHRAPQALTPHDAEAEQKGDQRQGVIVPVVVQGVGQAEPGKEQPPDGEEIEDRQDQQARACQRLFQPIAQALDQAGLTPQDDGDQAVDGDIDDEPQMVDRYAVGETAPTELMAQPGDEAGDAAGPAALVHRFDPGLDRHQNQGAEDQGRDQPLEPGASDLARGAPERHEPQGGAGHQKQQGQPPGIGDQDRLSHPLEGVGAVDVPVINPVNQADMIQDQQAEGADPDPVEIVTALGRGSGRVHGRVYDPRLRIRQDAGWTRGAASPASG
jgi:hypothetical protein